MKRDLYQVQVTVEPDESWGRGGGLLTFGGDDTATVINMIGMLADHVPNGSTWEVTRCPDDAS